ncbi:MAG: ATP-binding cassette domain-containing protein [Phycisphaerales bacterium]
MAEGRRNTSVGATAKAPALSMVAVRKRYGATVALDGVELAVREGEVHALLGENGAGKSTLMKVLAGVVAPDAGTMSLFGSTSAPRGPHAARRAGVAMIHQELALAPHLTVAENILLGDEPRPAGSGAARPACRPALPGDAGRDRTCGHRRRPPRRERLGVAGSSFVEIARASPSAAAC